MNSTRDLLKRLLHLYPIKLVKEHFGAAGNAVDVIEEISGSKTPKSIKDFAFNNSLFTRQNIYLFTAGQKFGIAKVKDAFPFVIEKEESDGNGFSFFCLPKTTFSVYLSEPMDKEDLSFVQPAMFRFQGKQLNIHFTKLEKNVQFHYPLNRQARKATTEFDEEQHLKAVLKSLEDHYTIIPNDFNKGIKQLWHSDSIDCTKIESRDPHSNTTTVMDEKLTYKEKYPEKYKAIIQTPLRRSHWKYLMDDDLCCENFVANPNEGELSISRFPKHPNQIQSVITKILAHN